MKSLKVKNILDKGAKESMNNDIKRNKDIREIEEALEEKRIRETQNLDLRLKKDKLCAEMRKIDEINGILNSTSHNGLGCPIGGEVVEHEHKTAECKHVCHPVEEVVVKEVRREEVHGEGCHCEKCCPNPKKTWFQKNKRGLSIGAIWVIMIVLALGLSPQGEWFTALQESYVNILVDLFKMGLFAVAGVITFKLTKQEDE